MTARDSQAGPVPQDKASTNHRRVPPPAVSRSPSLSTAPTSGPSPTRAASTCAAERTGAVEEVSREAWQCGRHNCKRGRWCWDRCGRNRRFREGGLWRARGARAASHLQCPTPSTTARRRWPGGRQQARFAVTEASYMMAAVAAGGSGAGCGNRAMAGQSRDGSHAHGLCEGGGGDLRDGKVAARVPFRPRGACARILRSNGTSVAGS